MTENDIKNPYWKLPEQGERKEIFYHYDEKEGKITCNTDSHDENDRIFIQQAWDNYGERAEEALKQVLAGLKSPLYYHMEKTTMELTLLAATVSLPKWRVKRHFKPNIYKKLKRSILERYARAFDKKVEDLDKID
jgi:hypothetical protein